MKTTIIELLNKIANNEEPPKKILFKNNIYAYTEEGYFDEENKDLLFDEYYTDGILNDEVEILETTITLDGKTINLEELKPAFSCPVGEKGKSVFDKIEKVYTYSLCNNDFQMRCDDGYNLCATEIINKAFKEYSYTINKIIDKLNKED